MKMMISQPMKGKTEEQVRAEWAKTVKLIEARGDEVVDTIFQDYTPQALLKYLAKSLEAMAEVDLVYFMPGWRYARGCRIWLFRLFYGNK